MTFRSILIFILLLTVQPVYAEDAYKFDPAVVELTGKLEKKLFYGPPGYGENLEKDSKEHAVILMLSKPISVMAEKGDQFNETRKNVKEIQLINLKEIPLSKYLQKKVKVTGKLSSAITGHHHTKVLIEIEDIQLQE